MKDVPALIFLNSMTNNKPIVDQPYVPFAYCSDPLIANNETLGSIIILETQVLDSLSQNILSSFGDFIDDNPLFSDIHISTKQHVLSSDLLSKQFNTQANYGHTVTRIVSGFTQVWNNILDITPQNQTYDSPNVNANDLTDFTQMYRNVFSSDTQSVIVGSTNNDVFATTYIPIQFSTTDDDNNQQFETTFTAGEDRSGNGGFESGRGAFGPPRPPGLLPPRRRHMTRREWEPVDVATIVSVLFGIMIMVTLISCFVRQIRKNRMQRAYSDEENEVDTSVGHEGNKVTGSVIELAKSQQKYHNDNNDMTSDDEPIPVIVQTGKYSRADSVERDDIVLSESAVIEDDDFKSY